MFCIKALQEIHWQCGTHGHRQLPRCIEPCDAGRIFGTLERVQQLGGRELSQRLPIYFALVVLVQLFANLRTAGKLPGQVDDLGNELIDRSRLGTDGEMHLAIVLLLQGFA